MRKDERAAYHIRLPKWLVDNLTKEAKALGISRNAYITLILYTKPNKYKVNHMAAEINDPHIKYPLP